MKKAKDVDPYKNVLPYSSEIFGVYQPMLGWRSKRILDRMIRGFRVDAGRMFGSVYRNIAHDYDLAVNADGVLETLRVDAGTLRQSAATRPRSFVVDALAKELPPPQELDAAAWDQILNEDRLTEVLDQVVVPQCKAMYRLALTQTERGVPARTDAVKVLEDQVRRESATAGYLLYLKDNGHLDKLEEVFYKKNYGLAAALQALEHSDPLEIIDPYQDLDRAGLSPIGIVHLFRQYFFEFDTFLGPPVSHVWLSPGSTVELVEINTRRTLVERTTETALETTVKTEQSITEQDELSDAVKDANRSETKFGVNATVTQGWIGGSATGSSSIDMTTTQEKAREVTHKHMRQQTDKLSTEIRRNYKSTFKTVTEVTDMSSKRYLLTNTTQELVNYELRRKMRQVGVQVQDIGTYLCWQTYVDDPGRQLGIAELVHVAKDPETGHTPPPEAVPLPQDVTTQLGIDIPFVQISEDKGDLDESYDHGKETDEDFNEGDAEKIQADFGGIVMTCDRPGYEHAKLEIDYGGNDIALSVRDLKEDPAGTITFSVHLDHVNFRGNSPIRVVAKATWRPTKASADAVEAENQKRVEQFKEQTLYEYQKAFAEAARDRINKAADVQSRKFEELREEERIVVYRSLVQDMLTKGIAFPDDRTRHVVAELLNTIFDIDKMLYFVAPEWWRPRLHQASQVLGGMRVPESVETPGDGDGSFFDSIMGMFGTDDEPAAGEMGLATTDLVSWGGGGEREDNYYITEDSQPAKLGSSLGWLLQLDGDNLRNAFLNAPWVKAVIPIRPGKERAAINWLRRVHVEGTDGLEDDYVAPPDELDDIPHDGPSVTVLDAIHHLCDLVAQKHEDAMEVGRYPSEEINDDNRVSATPVDKVYEHGFYPLQGGFRITPGKEPFEVFDQWVEVLPTDQVVPVEVEYDPKTGRQL